MKKLSVIQIQLLHLLADGACHSGIDLGLKLGVSRTAVWKQVKQLTQLGVPVISIRQQGYRLPAPLILLTEQAIRHYLDVHQLSQAFNLHILESVDSTNHYLKQVPLSSAIDVCCAEIQTAGRGRFSRSWHSPFGENIYCSLRWHFDCDLSFLSGLSLVVSLAVVATLAELGLTDHIRIKWPNDVLWFAKKVCGCLIEISAEGNGGADVIIGIGLNVNSATQENLLPDQPWGSLYEMCGHHFDRNQLLALLIMQLQKHIQQFIDQGFSVFQAQWQRVDYLKNQMITVSQPSGSLTGTANGINAAGQLKLIDSQGNIHYLSSGDTSLQKQLN